ITFELDATLDQVRQVCQSTELFHLAVSLGAVESLIEQPATMSHASYAPEARAAHGIKDSLIRLSVGLESPSDLESDLQQAFSAIN
ncbi:PLP-dependent transferase, partial [Rhodopirellula bahusiensis]